MGRDAWRFRQIEEERRKKKRINPVWRGVGCVLIVILGLIGYIFSGWFIQRELIYLPPVIRRPAFAPWLPEDMFVQIVVAFLFMLFAYTAMSVIYAIAFPIRLGETDAPPMKRRDRGRW